MFVVELVNVDNFYCYWFKAPPKSEFRSKYLNICVNEMINPLKTTFQSDSKGAFIR